MFDFLKNINKEPSRAFINFFRIEVLFGSSFIVFLSLFADHSGEIEFNIKITLSAAVVLSFLLLVSFIKKTWTRLARKLAFLTYFFSLVYTIYVAYNNQYNIQSFSALMIGYLFYLITLYNVKAFIRENTILILLIVISLLFLDFETKTDSRIILFSLLLLTAFGAIMGYSRKFMATSIKSKVKLINYIINNSRQGLILIDTKKKEIIEINSTAIKLLEYDEESKLKRTKIENIVLWNKQVFKNVFDRKNITIESDEGKILTIVKTEFSFDSNDLCLLEIKIYSGSKKYSEVEELEKLKLISEENYENLFNNSASFICIIDKKEKIVDVNNSIIKKSGYPRSKFIGKKYNSFDAKNYDKEREIYNEKAWNGKTQVFEKAIKANKGKIIELEVILKKGKYNGEDVLISNSRDISKRKELEEKVEIRTKTYKNLIENSSIAIAFTDLKGNFLEFNKAFAKYVEYSEEELLEMNIGDIMVDTNWERDEKIRKELLKGLKTPNESQREFLTKSKKKKHALLKYMLQSSEQENLPQMLLHQIVDITAIVETKDKLKESEESYKNLFNYSNELLYMVNEENKLIDVNQTVLDRYGYTKEEILKGDGTMFSAPDKNDLEEVGNLVERVWKGKPEKMLWWSITKTGEIFPKDLHLRRTTYLGKNVLLLSGRDISQQFEYEKQLKEGRKKYKDLIDSSSWGILIFQEDKIVFANNKALEILAINNEKELLKKNQYDFVKREKDARIFKKRLDRLKEGKKIPLSEYTLVNGKGRDVVIELRARLIEYEQEESILVSFIDINDRKEIEKAKRKVLETKSANRNLKLQLEQNRQIQIRLQNEQSYSEGIIESSLDMIFTTDKKGNLDKLNLAAKEKLGLDEKDYLGKPLNFLLGERKTEQRIVEELKKNKFFRGELKMKTKNGKTFIAYASFSYLFNAESDFLGIMGISRDISEIKKQEREIREQAVKLNTIIESSSHYFFTVDREFRFTSVNRRLKEDAKKGYGIDIKVNGSFFDLLKNIPQKSKEKYINTWNENFAKCFSGHMVEFETENRSKEGKSFFREVYLSPIYSDKGVVEEISGIGHDTTDKKLYERELKKSLKEKEVLLQEVHHRVKNNMQVISSILNLQSAYVKDKTILTILNDSQDRIRAMASIHERLYRTKNFSDIKFSSYIKNLAENLVNSYEYGDAQIELKCELDEIFLTLDTSIPCGLIVNELISNSLKYAFVGKDEGEIKVGLRQEKNKIILLVADNGHGISKEIDLKNIDTLGLQLVNTLVDQIEGEIEMIDGGGAKFIIKFEA